MNKKGQSTLEYVLILGAIVVVIIYAATRFIQPATERSFNSATSILEQAGGNINRTR